MSDNKLHEYLWIAVLGTILGFVYAFGIGANDVANSFASTVTAKSLTLGQAIVVAGIFEFVGAIGLGAATAGTVRGKIFDLNDYSGQSDIVMLGFFTSLITGTFMLLSATAFGLPVSTTHTIVGAIMGFTIVAKGFNSVKWDEAKKIFVSWAVSPLVTGFIAFWFFAFIHFIILQSSSPFERAYHLFPVVLTAGMGIDIFLFSTRVSTTSLLRINWNSTGLCPFCSVSEPCGVLWLVAFGPCVKQCILNKHNKADDDAVKDVKADNKDEPKKDGKDENGGEVEEDMVKPSTESPAEEQAPQKKSLFEKFADSTYRVDVEGQANDIANAVAPISAIICLYQNGTIKSKAPVQKWLLAYCGVGLVLGFAVFGRHTLKSLGYKMTFLLPSRGASAELASSLFVTIASFRGIPVSTTQCITGAISGVGLVNGWRNVQWFFLARVCVGWAGVFFSAVLMNAGVFAMFAFSPSLT